MIVAAGAGKEARIYSKKKEEISRILADNPWYAVDWGYDANFVAMGGTGGEVYEFFI